jgi:2-octaprenylphenol hydroxylase
MQKNYDITIVGGGIVGLALALLLAKQTLKVAVIEAKTLAAYDLNQYDLRVSALTPASIALLTELGVWDTVCAERVGFFNKMTIWVKATELNFAAADLQSTTLGAIVENRLLRRVLWDKATQSPNITLYAPAKVDDIIINPQASLPSEPKVGLILPEQTIGARLVVGADGHHSILRDKLGLKCQIEDYQQTALVTTVQTEHAHQQTAWQHFLPTGPLAFLPLDDKHMCSIVWSTTAMDAAKLVQMSEDEFNMALSTALEYRLGNVKVMAPRLTFPLQMQHVERYVVPGAVLIGDAAHRIHPLAGQGLNLGLMDAQCLARYIAQAKMLQKDWADYRWLKGFQRERKYYNSRMILLMKLLHHMFLTQSSVLVSVRDFGMAQLEHWPLFKRFMIGQL